jgi:hypothetical protein
MLGDLAHHDLPLLEVAVLGVEGLGKVFHRERRIGVGSHDVDELKNGQVTIVGRRASPVKRRRKSGRDLAQVWPRIWPRIWPEFILDLAEIWPKSGFVDIPLGNLGNIDRLSSSRGSDERPGILGIAWNTDRVGDYG